MNLSCCCLKCQDQRYAPPCQAKLLFGKRVQCNQKEARYFLSGQWEKDPKDISEITYFIIVTELQQGRMAQGTGLGGPPWSHCPGHLGLCSYTPEQHSLAIAAKAHADPAVTQHTPEATSMNCGSVHMVVILEPDRMKQEWDCGFSAQISIKECHTQLDGPARNLAPGEATEGSSDQYPVDFWEQDYCPWDLGKIEPLGACSTQQRKPQVSV